MEETMENWRKVANDLLEQNEQLAAALKDWMKMYKDRDEEIKRLHAVVERLMKLQGIPYDSGANNLTN